MKKVLVVEDSKLAQKYIARGIESSPVASQVTFAGDPYEAREWIARDVPDLILLDLELPRMSGDDFLKSLMKSYPLPVIVVSSAVGDDVQRREALLKAGALDIVDKPTSRNDRQPFECRLAEVVQRVLEPGSISVETTSLVSLIAIGASTGGPQALEKVLRHLPTSSPPVLVAQHMSDRFVDSLVQSLDNVCPGKVVQAVHDDPLKTGMVYIAPPSAHMRVTAKRRIEVVPMRDDDVIAPSVDELFHSLIDVRPRSTVAVMLTGMGQDGAAGMSRLHLAGAHTIAQDEATSVVFGMPKQAIASGAVESVLPVQRIGPTLLDILSAGVPQSETVEK